MKKLFALLLALMMVLSLAACGGGDDDKTPNSENNPPDSGQQQEQNTPDPDEGEQNEAGQPVLDGYLGTKTGKLFSQFQNGKMYMEYETEVEGMKMKIVSATSGDKAYSESWLDGELTGTTVMEGETMYVIDHAGKTVIKMGLNADMQSIAGTIVEESDINMDELKTGTKELDGKTYSTEEWTVDGVASIYCFDGDDLAYMIGVLDGEEMVMKVVEISDNVDDSLFEIPTDYTMMEL